MSGIFGIVSKEDCAKMLFAGTDYHSHLGTQFAGLAILGEGFQRRIHDISQSQFKAKFYEDYHRMEGAMGIGVISAKYEQPIYFNSKFGPFMVCANGLIENSKELAGELQAKGTSFSEMNHDGLNQIELIGKLIAQGESIVDGIEKMFKKIEGSCTLLLLSREGIYAARDRLGYTPLIIGQKGGDWAITTETCAFTNLGFEVKKYMQPAEIVLINESGLKQKRLGKDKCQVCSFLWIYTGFPASSYEGINVECVRERCGRALARNDSVKVDLVAGVPDSGVAHAIGYAMESKTPYRRPLVKYTPGYGRSYTPPSQETRDFVARMKLIPIKEVIDGKKILICEDSIVRG
ncbi:MAG: amidophosphoribosyltransferase, partial [Candidatus Omnitrophota bacterium]